MIASVLRHLLLAASLAAALLASSVEAGADEGPREQSRAAFRKGVTWVQEGNYTAARDAFLEAYKIFPHPSILLNLGIARAHTGEWVEAEQDLVRFLADDGGAQPDELASARAELAQTRSHLGTFRLRVSPDGSRAALDGKPIALIPGSFVDVRTTRGSHDLAVDADGFTPSRSTVVVAGERAPNVDLSLSAAGAPVKTRAEDRRTLAWFLLAGSGVAAAVGVYAGVEALTLSHAYNTAGSGSYQDQATKARGITFRTSADIAFLVALGLAGTGTYFLLAAPASKGAQARVVLGPGFGGIAGTF